MDQANLKMIAAMNVVHPRTMSVLAPNTLIGEQITKSTRIEPLLSALVWIRREPDEARRECRRT
jgi:hypothetical protein